MSNMCKNLKKKQSVFTLLRKEYPDAERIILTVLPVVVIIVSFVLQMIFGNSFSILNVSDSEWKEFTSGYRFLTMSINTSIYIAFFYILEFLIYICRKVKVTNRILHLPMTEDECEKLCITGIEDYLDYILDMIRIRPKESDSYEQYATIPKTVREELYNSIIKLYGKKALKEFVKKSDENARKFIYIFTMRYEYYTFMYE